MSAFVYTQTTSNIYFVLSRRVYESLVDIIIRRMGENRLIARLTCSKMSTCPGFRLVVQGAVRYSPDNLEADRNSLVSNSRWQGEREGETSHTHDGKMAVTMDDKANGADGAFTNSARAVVTAYDKAEENEKARMTMVGWLSQRVIKQRG